MKKEYNIVGLDCGHCALTLEKYLEKVKGVRKCNINFSTSKLFLEIDDDNSKSIIKDIFRTAKQVNPDVTITEEKSEQSSIKLIDIILYAIGLVIGLVVITIEMPVYLFYPLLIVSALMLGYKTYYKAIIQLKNFQINENTLVTLSIVGACLIGESMEGLMVIALFSLGKMLESKAVNYSRKSISKLISTQPEYATLYSNKVEQKVKPEVVKIGDIIIVKPGEKVPLDGIVIEGKASIDKKHLTGESEPVMVGKKDIVESGCIVLDSTLIIKVTSEYKDSTVSKILNLVSNATSKKSKTETFISKFAGFYTWGVIILAVVVFGISWLWLKDVYEAVYRGLIFLVVSCPCAFAISVPLSYFSGIGRCSKQGILVKGSNFLDICSRLDTMIFDKTGTLTTGKFVVTKVECKGVSEQELLDIVVAGESNSLHPIARAICEYHKNNSKVNITDYKEISGKGIEFSIKQNRYVVGRNKSVRGITCVEIVKNNKVIGKIYLQDDIKPDSKNMIEQLNKLGINTIMLTGDNEGVAKGVANNLGIEDYKAELLPKDKYKYIQELKDNNSTMAFVGDGINDAPALTLSDVGISMGIMGSPATIESSDIVIADDNLNKIPTLVKISKYTRKIVLENIVFAGVTKATFLILGALGITGMLLAVFADVGVTLLAILNSLRVLSYKTKK